MGERNFIVATAGHVDHGKSTLISRLTGTDPDRLPEEKRRGITIEPGFARCRIEEGEESPMVHFVDVPGHEDFVANMVAGLSGIDAALLVVAADSGWMPQTEEHVQILEYLGVRRCMVVINKVDMEGVDRDFVREVIRDDLSDTLYHDAPIVCASALRGTGLEELRKSLARMLATLPDPPDLDRPHLCVDRAFTMKGHGTVVTGSLCGGSLQVDDAVEIWPGAIASRIRTLQCFGEERRRVRAGSRVAVNLRHVAVRDRSGTTGAGRGDILTLPGSGFAIRTLDVVVRKSPRLGEGRGVASLPLRHGSRVRFHRGSTRAAGRILFPRKDALEPGRTRIARLRLEREVMVLSGDAFVLRDWSGTCTLAGGTVLDVRSCARHFRAPERQQHLRECAASENAAALALADLRFRGFMPEDQVLLRSRFGPGPIEASLRELEAQRRIRRQGGIAFEIRFWNESLRQVREVVETHHRDRPEDPGMPLSRLRSRLGRRIDDPRAIEAVVSRSGEIGLIPESETIRAGDHDISLPPPLRSVAERLHSLLGEHPDAPPSLRQLVRSPEEQRALRYLVHSGQVMEFGPDLVILQPAYQRLHAAIIGFLREQGEASVSQLRTHTGVSRRIMLPILESLDHRGVTIRRGDNRRLRDP